MSTDRTSPITVPNPENRQRRGSIADLFSRSNANPPTQTNQANQANQANQRRMSITTLGLSGSPTQTNTFGRNGSLRRGSLSSSIGSVPNEDAVEDSEGTSPSSQFARRVSFGAQALRDARGGSIGNGEGFNWSEALRSRAERAPSLSGPPRQNGHQRATSIASMETPSRDMPRQPKQNKPDFFQEKILRGDFMD